MHCCSTQRLVYCILGNFVQSNFVRWPWLPGRSPLIHDGYFVVVFCPHCFFNHINRLNSDRRWNAPRECVLINRTTFRPMHCKMNARLLIYIQVVSMHLLVSATAKPLIQWIFTSIICRWTIWVNRMTPSIRAIHSSAWCTALWEKQTTEHIKKTSTSNNDRTINCLIE